MIERKGFINNSKGFGLGFFVCQKYFSNDYLGGKEILSQLEVVAA